MPLVLAAGIAQNRISPSWPRRATTHCFVAPFRIRVDSNTARAPAAGLQGYFRIACSGGAGVASHYPGDLTDKSFVIAGAAQQVESHLHPRRDPAGPHFLIGVHSPRMSKPPPPPQDGQSTGQDRSRWLC
jgi:hypothetical protein